FLVRARQADARRVQRRLPRQLSGASARAAGAARKSRGGVGGRRQRDARRGPRRRLAERLRPTDRALAAGSRRARGGSVRRRAGFRIAEANEVAMTDHETHEITKYTKKK